MARITIEDCMEHVPNRFHLVQMASIRAKQLKKGARPLLSSEENKQVVMALREIAAGLVKPGEAAPETTTAPDPMASASFSSNPLQGSAVGAAAPSATAGIPAAPTPTEPAPGAPAAANPPGTDKTE